MSSLAEIEKAAEALSPQQKQELMLFLGARLPEPRQFSREQVQSWVAKDEADLKRFRERVENFPTSAALTGLGNLVDG
jgi:hypothetical protein